MVNMASRLPVGSIVFVIITETLYVRVRNGFRPATVSERTASSIYNNRIVKTCGHARGLRGQTGGRRRAQTGCGPE